MCLCQLLVSDYKNWRRGKSLEVFGTGYFECCVFAWKKFAENDLVNGRKRNWWYGFGNKTFLQFLKILEKRFKEAGR